MSGSLRGFSKLGAFVLLIAVLAFAGCSDNNLLGPDQTKTSQLDKPLQDPVPNTNIGVVEVEKEVSALTGDEISLDRGDYNHAFVVKPLALDKDELITIKSDKEDVLGGALTYEFGPAGLVFNESSKLEIEIAELNPRARSAKLYYLDPKTDQWVLQAEKTVRKGVVSFDINHFSKYAISD
ncbi:MAG: hypothetical protein GY839_15035 [candidate division Zixibacteria bacterium]|nr:hypothetical protein [candidate division Zixibacteria bacterium]